MTPGEFTTAVPHVLWRSGLHVSTGPVPAAGHRWSTSCRHFVPCVCVCVHARAPRVCARAPVCVHAHAPPVCVHAPPVCVHAPPVCVHAPPVCVHAPPVCVHAPPVCVHAPPACVHAPPVCVHARPSARPPVCRRRWWHATWCSGLEWGRSGWWT